MVNGRPCSRIVTETAISLGIITLRSIHITVPHPVLHCCQSVLTIGIFHIAVSTEEDCLVIGALAFLGSVTDGLLHPFH